MVMRYALGSLNHVIEAYVNSPKVWLRITGDADAYRFFYSMNGEDYRQIGTGDTRYLSSETVGGFTGIMIGLWSQCPDVKTNVVPGFADFEYFEYRGE